MAQIDGVEIPDDFLNSVSGGVLTPQEREGFIEELRYLKSHGILKERIIEVWSSGQLEDNGRVDLVKEIYDTL